MSSSSGRVVTAVDPDDAEVVVTPEAVLVRSSGETLAIPEYSLILTALELVEG